MWEPSVNGPVRSCGRGAPRVSIRQAWNRPGASLAAGDAAPAGTVFSASPFRKSFPVRLAVAPCFTTDREREELRQSAFCRSHTKAHRYKISMLEIRVHIVPDAVCFFGSFCTCFGTLCPVCPESGSLPQPGRGDLPLCKTIRPAGPDAPLRGGM